MNELHIAYEPMLSSPTVALCGAALTACAPLNFCGTDFYTESQPKAYLEEDERFCPCCVALWDAGVRE